MRPLRLAVACSLVSFVACRARSTGSSPPDSRPEVATPAAGPDVENDAMLAKVTWKGVAGDRPQLVTFPSGALTLHGFLWQPEGPGPFPAIVYNHGSGFLPGPLPGEAMFFVPRGFALFVPHRRGQGRSAEAGRYIDTFYDAAAYDSSAFVDELVAQSDDVMAAVRYTASLPYVDPKRIAVVGCSLGGIESLLAAERGDGIVAAVDFAGAAMTWGTNGLLQGRMKQAARNAKVPVLFLQAENDFDTTPSRVLSEEMRRAGKKGGMHIYPPNGVKPEDGHAFCVGGSDPAWGAEVLQFLRESMGSN